MIEKYYISKKDNTDLNLYRCGFEECSPGYAWGPGVRDHYIIHLILSGEGSFTSNGISCSLKKGQGFVICPGQIVRYEADKENPWTYSWAGFHGLKAENILKKAGLSPNTPVFTFNGEDKLPGSLNELILAARSESPSDLQLTGCLYLFLSQLIQIRRRNMNEAKASADTDRYVSKAVEYIEKNYAGRLSVSLIAQHLKIDRSYLSALFSRHLNLSPRDFIIRYRMDKAAELLKNPLLNVSDVARSVGYEDPLQFSKTFRKTKGDSPRNYREKHHEKT